MKIATWNLERPTKGSNRTLKITSVLQQLQADILVLTETNDCINLGSAYQVFHTMPLQDAMYKTGERRVSIFSKYPLVNTGNPINTFNAETAVCINLSTPLGILTVYGTIIGVLGNKGNQFKNDLDKQLTDFVNIAGKATNFCICGDMNMSFSDNYYFTKDGRNKLNASFLQLGLTNYTAQVPHNIDHIILSEKFADKRTTNISWWNDPNDPIKRLSDHKGVMLEIL